MSEQQASENWIRVADVRPSFQTYRVNSNKFGQWLEVSAEPNPRISIINELGIKETVIDGKTCEVKIATDFKSITKHIAKHEPIFNDVKFGKLIEDKSNSLIYLWSPKMIYSVKYMDQFKQAAARFGLDFIPVLDPMVSDEELKKTVGKKFKYPIVRMGSVEILMREMTVHYPSTLVVYKGVVADPFIFGVKQPSHLDIEISQRILKAKGRVK